MEQKNFFLKGQVCESLVNAARFTTDLIFGSSYLSTEEYLQRHAIFWKDYGSTITADNVVDLTAQILADFVYCKGIPSLFTFLKKIDAATKMEKQIAKVAETFKKAVDTRLAKNPSFITAEGIVLQMSNDLKNVGGATKEIINSSRALIESTYAPIAEILIAEIEAIVDALPKLPNGFGKFANEQIQISYMHILGLEINWIDKINELSKLSGFHHDLKGLIEKNGIIKFTRKIIDKNGCYSAILQMEGVRPVLKTFFPADWSRKQVIDKILEAYESFKRSGINARLAPDGKYEIIGLTQEGIQIKMHITQNGIIKSAYPIVNGFGV